ncbi:hypothetical protein DNTS_009257 [Danionella cerebrum]|uniref:Endoplasmic reticulum junction formation protein lunapark n=1 Tax=Danionella cerebrum TaxID=2873325 RepID=A0A553Q5K2_9TELE|nr:hypothetical protein DNTS_009257 [Danionella translucida]
MGAIISRWRAKPSTVEVLESLDKEIKDLEEFRAKNQRLMKLWVGRLLFYSSALYLLTCLFVYYLYLPEQWSARIITALPLLAFPALVLLLEEVMETETYKNAKLILERFDPESKKKAEAEPTPVRPHMTPRPGQELRQRNVAMATPGVVAGALSPGATPLRAAPGGPPEKGLAGCVSSPAGASPAETPQHMMRRSMNPYSPGPGAGMHPPGPPLARPILPRERTAVDRVIEYLVGDGPQNRYALICQQCFSHNGMALKEEFEYVGENQTQHLQELARKTRPQAPRLPEFSFERRLRSESPETQSSLATETPEDSDAPEDDAERNLASEEQEPSAEAPQVTHEAAEDVSPTERPSFTSDDVVEEQEPPEAQREPQGREESN